MLIIGHETDKGKSGQMPHLPGCRVERGLGGDISSRFFVSLTKSYIQEQ